MFYLTRRSAAPSVSAWTMTACTVVICTAVCLALLFTGAGAALAAAGPVTVNLRVETPTETLFNGAVSTAARLGDRGVNLAPSPPDPNTCTHATDPVTWGNLKQDVASATTLTAAADFADADGLDHIVKDFGWGRMLCGLGAYLGNNDAYWLVKVGNKSQNAGGYVTADSEVQNGDEVLWYFTNALITHTLDLNLPAQAIAGETVTGSVTKFSNYSDASTPARGAAVEGGGASGVADVNGRARLKFAEPGSYLVSAAAGGATRGSDVIEVLEKPGPDAQSKARRVCAKYRRGWRKYNKRYKKIYKRCFRSATLRFANAA